MKEALRDLPGEGGEMPPALERGATVHGVLWALDSQLPSGEYYDVWTYQSTSRERLTVTMRSEQFDTYLGITIGTAQGDGETVQDDDHGGGTNARLVVNLPAAGSHHIVATSFAPGETGAYTLSTPDWAERYPGGGDPNGRYALLVGAGDYPGSGNDIFASSRDAIGMRDLLIEQYGFDPDNIVVLLDEEAYRENILQAFSRHLGQAGPDGVAVFFYSGHGTQMEGNEYLDDVETDGVDEALFVWGVPRYPSARSGYILDDELGVLADGLSAERVLIILDSCFSGTGTRAPADSLVKFVSIDQAEALTRPQAYFGDFEGDQPEPAITEGADPELMEFIPEPQSHVLLAAATDTELSWADSPGGRYSAFTYYLLRALAEDRPNETFRSLIERVRPQTVAFSRRVANQHTPQVEGSRADVPIRDYLARR